MIFDKLLEAEQAALKKQIAEQQAAPAMGRLTLSWRKIITDPSFWTLVASNVIAIYLINRNHIAVHNVLLIYWFQSVIIGLVNVARISLLKNFSADGLKINGETATNSRGTKINAAVFFLLHYGFFHLVYLVFIFSSKYNQPAVATDWPGVLSVASIFLLSHLYSFVYNFKSETENKDLGTVMFSPYLRIVPMHIALIAGATSGAVLLNVFLFLRAAMDLLGHGVKHRGKNIILQNE